MEANCNCENCAPEPEGWQRNPAIWFWVMVFGMAGAGMALGLVFK